jgi:hypothetical protein
MRDNDLLGNLYGQKTHPYFIYAPRWIDTSAGIKALHFLCHSINIKGHKAYLVLTEAPHQGKPRINPHLSTPILTQEISDAYFMLGINPVLIYSETIPGNPLGGNFIVRYLMNYAGALGGSKSFDENEYILAFSKKIAEEYASTNKTEEPMVLFLPPIDPREFTKQTEKKPYQVVYAGKYRSFIGKPPKVGTLPTVEIFRDGPRMQTRKQVKEILSNATVVYSFENSSIVTESILSGTPARFVPNEFLGEIIAEVELGVGGIILGDSEQEFEIAQKSIDAGISQYYNSADTYLVQLEKFIDVTQERAAFEGFMHPITVPIHGLLFSQHRLRLAWQILKHQGLPALARVTYHFTLRRLSWRFWVGREVKAERSKIEGLGLVKESRE